MWVMEVLRKRTFELAKGFSPTDLGLLVHSFAQLGLKDVRLFAVLAAEICRNIHHVPPRILPLIANAYSKLSVQNRFLLEVLGQEVFRKRAHLKPQGVALVLNTFSKLGVPNKPLFDYFAKEIKRQLKYYNLQSICLVASAYSKANHLEPALFEAMAERVGRHSTELYPKAVASLLYSFSLVKYRHGPMFFYCPRHVCTQLSRYSLDQLGMVVRAFTVMNIHQSDVLDRIINASFLTSFTVLWHVKRRIEKGAQSEVDVQQEEEMEDPIDPKEDHTEQVGGRYYRISDGGQFLYIRDNGKIIYKDIQRVGTTAVRRRTSRSNADDLWGLKTVQENNNFALDEISEVVEQDLDEKDLQGGGEWNIPRVVTLVWILQAMAHMKLLDQTAFGLICSELCKRAVELSGSMTCHVLHSLTCCNLHHRRLVSKLLYEIKNPQVETFFTSSDLEYLHNALKHFGIPPEECALQAAAPAGGQGEDCVLVNSRHQLRT